MEQKLTLYTCNLYIFEQLLSSSWNRSLGQNLDGWISLNISQSINEREKLKEKIDCIRYVNGQKPSKIVVLKGWRGWSERLSHLLHGLGGGFHNNGSGY